MKKYIPNAVAKRLSLYYRYLRTLNEEGIDKVSSAKLSELVKVDSATIRRDFSYFGAFGRPGYGYDVSELLGYFGKVLNQRKLTNVAIVGIGSLGHAFLHYSFRPNNNIRISAGFDINPKIVDTISHDIPIYHVDQMAGQLEAQQIKYGIITVPPEAAQEAAELMVKGGVKGILNLTSGRVTLDDAIKITHIDIADELQSLIYLTETHSDEEVFEGLTEIEIEE